MRTKYLARKVVLKAAKCGLQFPDPLDLARDSPTTDTFSLTMVGNMSDDI